MLPDELVQVLNEAYFLHVLATDPTKVLPAGKSLLSMMVPSQHRERAATTDPSTILHDRVEEAVHRAFWNEALESLSSPSPSTQLPRLKALYTDLLDALSPLFPPQHPVLQSLSFPLPPTSSPLHSALALVKEILAALRHRCAPVRDPDIDALLAKIDEQLPQLHGTSQAGLAALVVDVFRSLVFLADTLKSDLTQSVLGAMSETQLAAVVAQQARTRERELVLDMWGGKENVHAAWGQWIASESPSDEREAKESKRKRWVAKLIKTLALPIPVSCEVPSPSSHIGTQALSSAATDYSGIETKNELPPQFFFTAPTLFHLQNLLQALVIAGSLRSLTRIPLPSSSVPGSDFVPRVWTLLKAEIDRDEFAIGVGATSRGQEDPTRIINLADEAIRARRLSSGTVTEQEEKSLREAVERTLRPRDPVFLLLLERVVHGIQDAFGAWMDGASAETAVHHRMPERMRAGRGVGGHQGYGAQHDRKGTETLRLGPSVSVKGFEDPVLVKGVEDLITRVIQCVQWTEEAWGDLI